MSEGLTVQTDKKLYYGGDTVRISGAVDNELVSAGEQVVVIQVFDIEQEKLVRIDPVDINALNGSYSYEFVIEPSPVFNLSVSEYKVVVTYRGQEQAQTTFRYDAYRPLTCESYSGNGSSSGGVSHSLPRTIFIDNEHAIRYIGFIKNITAVTENNSILIDVSGHPTSFNCIVISLPRAIIEAVDSENNGTDIDFIVNVDGSPATFAERYRGEEGREMVIHFSNNTQMIEIIGTRVIPEFGGLIAPFLMTAAIAGIIIAARRGSFNTKR